MTRRLPPLKTLPAFVIAARLGSFSAAANELHLTHGAVSRQIKALESYLGVRLFRRLSHQVSLTPPGAAFLSAAQTALDLIEGAVETVATHPRRSPLVVAALPSFAMRWLIPRLGDFSQRHPEVEVRIAARRPGDKPSLDGIDLVIETGVEIPDGDCDSRILFEEYVGPVCSPALVRRHPLGSVEDLHDHILLHTETRPAAWPLWLQAAGADSAPAREGPRFEHYYFLLQAAISGLGVAIAPYPLVEEDIAAGRLTAPFGFRPGGRHYAALYPRGGANAPRIQAFLSWLVGQAATSAATLKADPPPVVIEDGA